MPTVNIWAGQITCPDARMLDEKGNELYPGGFGEPGWDVGVKYHSAKDLALKLRPYRAWITKLAIESHGEPGEFAINFGAPELNAKNVREDGKLKSDLNDIKESLAADAVVLLMGCNAGRGL